VSSEVELKHVTDTDERLWDMLQLEIKTGRKYRERELRRRGE
jgi:hypothetical protein